MDYRIFKYVPNGKRAGVLNCYHDDDGYWIILCEGWHIEHYYAERTIHEDTIAELRAVIKRIKKD